MGGKGSEFREFLKIVGTIGLIVLLTNVFSNLQ